MRNFGTFILYIVLPLVALGVLFWYGWGGSFGKISSLSLKDVYAGNLGVVSSISPDIEKDITIVNKSAGDVIIRRIYTDCKCLLAKVSVGTENLGPFSVPSEENVPPLGIAVPAGGEIAIKIIFVPKDSPTHNFSGKTFIETLKSEEVLKIPVSAKIINEKIN